MPFPWPGIVGLLQHLAERQVRFERVGEALLHEASLPRLLIRCARERGVSFGNRIADAAVQADVKFLVGQA